MDLDTLRLSKLCQICQRPASDKETYYNHYGAISCLGCKAFFGSTTENARKHTIANITEIVKCPTKQRSNLANTAVTRNV